MRCCSGRIPAAQLNHDHPGLIEPPLDWDRCTPFRSMEMENMTASDWPAQEQLRLRDLPPSLVGALLGEAYSEFGRGRPL